MARLKNANSGVIVNVADSKVDRLGFEWQPVDGSGRTPAGNRSETPDATWKVAELKAYADDNGIDLGKVTAKPDIIAAIVAASESLDDDEYDDTDDDSTD